MLDSLASSSQGRWTVFHPPELGKVDPYAPFAREGRPFVIQQGQKGETCEYYAMQRLRGHTRIGKDPEVRETKQRQSEQKLSDLRKKITQITEKFGWKRDFSHQLHASLGKTCTRMKMQFFLERGAHFLSEDIREKCILFLRSFCEQTESDDLLSFVQNAYDEARINAYESLLDRVRVPQSTPKKILRDTLHTEWEEASLANRSWALQATVTLIAEFVYGLKKASWHPEQPIEALIDELKMHGNLFVKGKIGRSYYSHPPFQLEREMEGQALFGWKGDNPKLHDTISTFHAVVLVGAEITETQQLVYFIDPLDSSDPDDPSTQKIYVMSYQRLQEQIADLWGVQRRSSEGDVCFQERKADSNNYALYKA